MLPLSKVQHGAVPDYLQHFIGYSAMGFWFGQLHPKHVWVAVALVAFGFSIEVLQPILSDRMFEWGDVTVNALAILVGLLVSRTQAGGLVGVLDRRLARR
jgi:VanZ family protein